MYSIYADGICIYNDAFALDNMKVIDPKLTLEDSAAGSLSMILPPSNIGYGTIVRMVSDISVHKDGEEIWAGRVLSEDKDFWNNRVLFCEGELAFLNDSTQPPAEYYGQTVRGFLETLITIHNSKVTNDKQFTIGSVTVTDPNDPTYRYTNYEKTIECINEKLVKKLGGHLRIRKVNGVRYLDYLADYPNTNSQIIEFSKNLLDFTRKWDLTEFATVIIPLGNRLDESPIEALDAYLTVEGVNNGSLYVQSSEAVASYGWIEKVIHWDDVSTASSLLSKAEAYLSDIQFDNMSIELSALDLHYLDVNYEAVKLLDELRVISKPHGMDRHFPVTKLEIPLDSPEKTLFKLGDTIKTSLTSVNNQTNTNILQKIENLPKAQSVLKEAKENATQIMNMATNGYITITQDQYGTNTMYISNDKDYTVATKLWKWNINGLAYSNDGGETFGLAMTMDGAIVADFITTGTLNADLITIASTLSKLVFTSEGLKLFDENNILKVHLGSWLEEGVKKYALKIIDGEIYGSKYKTGTPEGTTKYVEIGETTNSYGYVKLIGSSGNEVLEFNAAGDQGKVVFADDGNNRGNIMINGATTKELWINGNGNNPGINISTIDGESITLGSHSGITDHGVGISGIRSDLSPYYSGTGNVGTSSHKWASVRAYTVTSGDLAFEEDCCPICGEKFQDGDVLVMLVKTIHEGLGTLTIPMHERCKSTSKTITLPIPVYEKKYRLNNLGNLEEYLDQAYEEVEEEIIRIHPDYELDEKNGTFKRRFNENNLKLFAVDKLEKGVKVSKRSALVTDSIVNKKPRYKNFTFHVNGGE